MILLYSFNCDVKYLLCVRDIFIKYSWFKPLKDRKTKTVLNGFVETISESKRKPNKLYKLWFDQGREFHKCPMQK